MQFSCLTQFPVTGHIYLDCIWRLHRDRDLGPTAVLPHCRLRHLHPQRHLLVDWVGLVRISGVVHALVHQLLRALQKLRIGNGGVRGTGRGSLGPRYC